MKLSSKVSVGLIVIYCMFLFWNFIVYQCDSVVLVERIEELDQRIKILTSKISSKEAANVTSVVVAPEIKLSFDQNLGLNKQSEKHSSDIPIENAEKSHVTNLVEVLPILPGPDRSNSGPDRSNSGPDRSNSGPELSNSGPERSNSGPERSNSGPERSNSEPKVSIFRPELEHSHFHKSSLEVPRNIDSNKPMSPAAVVRHLDSPPIKKTEELKSEIILPTENVGSKFEMPPPMVHSISTDGNYYRPDTNNLLVVGGTDGSGSRRAVTLLAALGVKMITEDQFTYDIHASEVGGWPNFVKPVIEHTHSLNYSPLNLPHHIQQHTTVTVNQVVNKVLSVASNRSPYIRSLQAGVVVEIPPGVRSSKVNVGFKAPVSMAVLPFFVQLYPHVMFLHVLRDGRDIAFSSNVVCLLSLFIFKSSNMSCIGAST